MLECWKLDFGYCVLDIGYWILEVFEWNNGFHLHKHTSGQLYQLHVFRKSTRFGSFYPNGIIEIGVVPLHNNYTKLFRVQAIGNRSRLPSSKTLWKKGGISVLLRPSLKEVRKANPITVTGDFSTTNAFMLFFYSVLFSFTQ